MDFRKDINGLRAYAVLAVTLFHFGVPHFQGGFVGVDVFFVISGYLMTALISRKVDIGKFSLFEFYVDRARRIIPALAFLCLVLILVGWFILLPFQYALLGKHVASSLGFFSNIVFWREAGYFDLSSNEKWLLHTWSLSVEWQFYILYPLVMLGINKAFPERWRRYTILALLILSYTLAALASYKSPTFAFYSLPTRTWELLLGGAAYLFPIWSGERSSKFIEWIGACLIAFSIFLFDSNTLWPGWLAAIPTMGALLIVLSRRSGSKLTHNPIAQFLGNTSYSIYLWHWPFVVALNQFGKLEQPIWCVGGIVLSILCGYLSYVFIETPTRRLGRQPGSQPEWSQKRIVLTAGMVIFTIDLLGSILFVENGFPGNIRSINRDERARFVEKYEDIHLNHLYTAYRAECDFHNWKTRESKTSIDDSCTAAKGKIDVFLWGDSHAQALSFGLRDLFLDLSSVAQVATSGCEPSLRMRAQNTIVDNNCNLSNKFALESIARIKPAIVILAQAQSHELTDWSAIAQHLYTLGVKRVVLIGPMPNWRPSLPIVVIRKHWSDGHRVIKDGLDESVMRTDKILEARYGHSSVVTYISLIQSLCGNDGCISTVPGKDDLMVVDYGHLSPAGSIYVAKTILGNKLLNIFSSVEKEENLKRKTMKLNS